MATNTAVYAAVDMSKKKKRSLPETQEEESPMYDTAGVDMNLDAKPTNEGQYSEYSMVTLDNMYSMAKKTQPQQESEQSNTDAIITNASANKQTNGVDCRKVACVFVVTIIVALALVTLACIAGLFTSVTELKSQSSDIQQLDHQQTKMMQLLQQQIQQNISEIVQAMQLQQIQQQALLLQVQQNITAIANEHNTLINNISSSFTQQLDDTSSSFTRELDDISSALQNHTLEYSQIKGLFQQLPIPSCAILIKFLSIHTPSGYYWVN
jgi:hypothetical protein